MTNSESREAGVDTRPVHHTTKPKVSVMDLKQRIKCGSLNAWAVTGLRADYPDQDNWVAFHDDILSKQVASILDHLKQEGVSFDVTD